MTYRQYERMPMYRAEFFRFCGGHLEADPEFVAGLSLAINSYVRRQGAT
jgi:hypothetical protein